MYKLAPVLSRIVAYEPQTVDIGELTYREGLNVVWLEAGIATNTLPNEAVLRVGFRFAPSRSADAAMVCFREVLRLDEFVAKDLTVDAGGVSPGVLPGLCAAAAKELAAVAGDVVKPKLGWTDVARFSALGVPAVDFGPGDSAYCHRKDEQIPVECITVLWEDSRRYLTTAPVVE